MSDNTDNGTASPGNFDSATRYTGRVKWFNNKAGYGFVTVCLPEGDERVADDVFVHHSGVKVSSEQYKYLVQGEYVSFNLRSSDSNDHPFQAADITGIAGGKLMCETRWEARQNAAKNSEDEGDGEKRPPRRRNWNSGGRNDGSGGNNRVRLHGTGPREGETWVLSMEGNDNRRPRRPRRPRQNDV